MEAPLKKNSFSFIKINQLKYLNNPLTFSKFYLILIIPKDLCRLLRTIWFLEFLSGFTSSAIFNLSSANFSFPVPALFSSFSENLDAFSFLELRLWKLTATCSSKVPENCEENIGGSKSLDKQSYQHCGFFHGFKRKKEITIFKVLHKALLA